MKRRNQFWIGLSLSTCLLISITVMAEVTVNQESPTDVNHARNSFAVGDKILKSGIVFFIDDTGVHGLVAKTTDEMGAMIWSDAVAATEAKDSGWRLPTSAELLLLYTYRKLIGGFSNDDYWSATEQDVNSAWIQGFRTGDQDRYNKFSKLRVRVVRAF
jgi:Protein of unknown function (DUF1566)